MKTVRASANDAHEQGGATKAVVAKGVPVPVAQLLVYPNNNPHDKTARCRSRCRRFLAFVALLGLAAVASAAVVAEVVEPAWLCAPWQDDCVGLFERRTVGDGESSSSSTTQSSLVVAEARASQLVVDLDVDGSGLIEVGEIGQVLDNLGLLLLSAGNVDQNNHNDHNDQNDHNDRNDQAQGQPQAEAEASVLAAVALATAEAEATFATFDSDGNGALDPIEFMELVFHRQLLLSGSADDGESDGGDDGAALPALPPPSTSDDGLLWVGDVCYRFCEDSALEFVDRRGDCPSGTVCQAAMYSSAAGPGSLRGGSLVGFDNCYSPDVCVVEGSFETDEAIVNELNRLRDLIDSLTATLGGLEAGHDLPATPGAFPAGHPCNGQTDCASNVCDFDLSAGSDAPDAHYSVSVCIGNGNGNGNGGGFNDNGDDFDADGSDFDADGGWHECAPEGGVCACPGGVVRYGMPGLGFTAALATAPADGPTGGLIDCTNAVFGDPLHGVVKKCECRQDAALAPECSHHPWTCSSCSAPPCECRVASSEFFCESMSATVAPIDTAGFWRSWGSFLGTTTAASQDGDDGYSSFPRAHEEKGFCVKSNGSDENAGVVKLASGDHETAAKKEDCLRLCREYAAPGDTITGCEMIWDQSNRGCYVHTSAAITHGNGANRHSCYIGDASVLYAESEVPAPPPADVYDCDTTTNFVLGASYSQVTINSLMTPDVTSMAAALDECQRYCSDETIVANCSGFFYQQHTNTHQICGFFETDFEEMNAPTHHGHTEGAVCSKRV